MNLDNVAKLFKDEATMKIAVRSLKNKFKVSHNAIYRALEQAYEQIYPGNVEVSDKSDNVIIEDMREENSEPPKPSYFIGDGH